jgi:hypothetical protein
MTTETELNVDLSHLDDEEKTTPEPLFDDGPRQPFGEASDD